MLTPLRFTSAFTSNRLFFRGHPEASWPSLGPVWGASSIFISRAQLVGFLRGSDLPTLISASIQLQYSLTLITSSPETGSITTDLQAWLLSTCNPLQIITDYWADAPIFVVIINETDGDLWLIHSLEHMIKSFKFQHPPLVKTTKPSLWWWIMTIACYV